MRERLVELLKAADKRCGDTKQCENCVGFGHGKECVNQLIADYLLANGVVVPPCKVGDTVYCIWQYGDFAKTEPPFIKKSKAVSFIINDGVAKVIPEDYAEMTDRWHRLITVAFTKEEAEQALKGGEQE